MEFAYAKRLVPPDARFRLGRSLLHRPKLAAPYLRFRPAFRDYRFRSDAQLVIDGFPRSANTYAWHAARLALGPDAVICGHTHSPMTLITAARNSIPSILLLRDPDDAVASYVQQAAGVRLATAFKAYTDFHIPLTGWRAHLIVADFDQVVTDFGSVLERTNRQFGSRLPSYDATATNEELVLQAIDDASRARWGGVVREAGVARPSAQRRRATDVLVNLDQHTERRRGRAQELYRELGSLCSAW